jgi:F0F1-type ATP synthase membrane subunit b/b'
MSDDTFRWVVAGGVLIVAVCFIVQAVTVLILFTVMKKTQVRVEGLIDKADPIIDSVKAIAADLQPKLAVITTDATDIVRTAKEQVERISELVRDFSDRAKVQVARIDGTMEEAIEQVHTAGDAVKSALLKPVREVNGLFAGLRTAIGVYTQGHRASVDHATQDEEMFI